MEDMLQELRSAMPSAEDIDFIKSMAFQGPDMTDRQEKRVRRIIDGFRYARMKLEDLQRFEEAK